MSNLKTLTDAGLTRREATLLEEMFDPWTWALDVANITLPKGGKIELHDRPFLREIFRDMYKEIVVIKGAQLGVSTTAMVRTFWFLTTFPSTAIYCVDDKTEMLSRRGWTNYPVLGEDILTLDLETGRSRWSPVLEVFDEPYAGPMVEMKTHGMSALVTPNHRWPVVPMHGSRWHVYETHDLPKYQRIARAAPFDAPTMATYTDDEVELFAWVITEGSYRHETPGDTGIVLTQNEGPSADRMRALLIRLGARARDGTPGGSEYEQGKGRRLFFVGDLASRVREVLPDKELTPALVQSLTATQLRLLVDTMLDGDGDRAGREMFHQKSKATADAFAMAVALTGRGVSTRSRSRMGSGLVTGGPYDMNEVRVKRSRWTHTETLDRVEIPYEGRIWCPRSRDLTFLARRDGTVYWTGNTFPTGSDVSRFTQARINPLVQGSPYLADRIVNVNSVKVKQFGLLPTRRGRFNRPIHEGPRSTLYFSGSINEKDATTVDADLLIHDEEDLSSPQIIEQFSSRLAASRFGWKFRLSTPRIPGAGIDRVFSGTDGRKWLIRCPLCNHDQELAFPGGPWDYSNVEPDPNGWTENQWEKWDADGRPARYVCARCGKPLEDDDRLNGRWVISKPLNEIHGYQVSQLAAPWISASDVLQSFRKATWPSDFWNLVMGIAWQEGSSVMSEEAIMNRCSGYPMALNGVGCTAGIDVGAKFDVVVGKMQGGAPTTVWMGRLDSYEELDKVMADYGVARAVIDAAPEEHASRAWADKYNRYPKPGSKLPSRIRVWRAVYGGGAKGAGQQIKWNDQTGVVQAPRTEILSLSAEELLHDRVLPKYDGSAAWRAYIAHHIASKKVPKFVEGLESDGVVERYEWHEVGPDHMFHAGTYEMMARMAPQPSVMPKIGLITTRRGKAHDVDGEAWKRRVYRTG